MSDQAIALSGQARRTMYARAFWGLIRRDLIVAKREAFQLSMRTIMNPFLFVFVFAYVFPKIGQQFQAGGGISFATIIVPGLVGSAIIFNGISAVALPLVMEFGATREIEDRVMAPLPTAAVAIEKIVFSAVQAVIAGLVVFPFVYLIPSTPVSVHVDNWPLLIGVFLVAGLVSSALGMAIGTVANPRQIGLVFALIVIPVTFLGCVYYPWARLQPIRWLQILVLVNPLVYISEGLRTALTPGVPHMHPWAFFGALLGMFALLMWMAMRGFLRRVID
ncbi:MAG: ABC transporter permease [Actinomycetota bacterium]